MSPRTRRGLTLLWVGLFVFSLLLQYASFAVPAKTLAYVGNSATSPFELDGNAIHSAGHDWDQVYADRNDPAAPYANSGADNQVFVSDVTGAGDDILTGGNTKDTENISSWLWKQSDVTSVQDKDDIENAFAAAYTGTNGHTLGYFGLDRFSIDGDATAGFWFFKNGIAKSGDGSGNGTGFSGVHANGDVLVVIDFSNGGASGTAQVYTWQNGALVAGASGTNCSTASQTVCAISNITDQNSPWPYAPKSGTANVFPAAPIKGSSQGAGALYEGGIDMTALGLDTGCFSSFMAETRSSNSETSTLSDFVLGNFSFCETPTLETQVSDSSVSVGDSVTDTATLSGNKGAVTGTVDFFVCGPTNVAQACTSGGTAAGANKPITNGTATSNAVTASAAGFYCFRAEYTPTAGNHYLATSHTNATTECFQAKPASVHVTKTADDASVSAGDQIGFTVTLENTGTGQAHGVSFTDDLPAGTGVSWSIDAANSDAGWSVTGSAPSQHLAFSGTTLNAGASTSAHIISGTTAASCKAYDNTASVTTTNDGSDSDDASTTVNCPDVKVTKTPDGGKVDAGDPITWTIKVENIGDGIARGVTLTDDLPAGTTWSETEADCSIAGAIGSQVLSCTVGDLAKGASKTYTVTGPTTKDNCGEIDNTATASATNEPSGSLANNSDDGDVTVECAEIDLTKVADAASVSAGSEIGFVLTASNNGAGTAHGVTITDTLPTDAGLSWSVDAANSDSGCSISSGVLTCSFGDLASGASKHVHITSTTTKDSCGVVDNTGNVTTSNDGSDEASASVTVNCPIIDVAKTADAASVNAGSQIGFTVTLSNTGLGNATGLSFTDDLPAGTGVSWSIDPASSGWSITGTAPTQHLVYSPTTLAAGASTSVHIVSATTGESCKTYDNTAQASATNDGSDSASASVVVTCPDVTVEKTADNGTISAGETAAFTITVSNVGAGTALAVILDDTLPAGSWTTTDVRCQIASGHLTCDLGNLAANASTEVHVSRQTVAADCGTLHNVVDVSASNEAEADTDNNHAEADIEVDCPTVVITKTADHETVNAGDQIGFAIEVTNTGAGSAFGTTVDDLLPTTAGLSWSIDAAGSSSGWTIDSGHLKFGPATLAAGASTHVHITSPTTAASCAAIPNTATVTTSNDGGDDDDATVTVECPNVTVVKTADKSPINAADTAAFTIVVSNTGDGTATNVTLHDPLPSGVAWTIDPAVEGCAITAGTLDCAWDELAPDASVTIHVNGTTDAADCGTLPNTATVAASNEAEADTDDNESSASIVVLCANIDIEKVADEPSVSAGSDIGFTITVTNNGQGTAYGVHVSDPLPTDAGTSWSIDSGPSGAPGVTCAIASGTLTCDVASLGSGGTFHLHITSPTTKATVADSPVVNAATVTTTNDGSDEDDDQVVVLGAAIDIEKVADAPVAEAGTEIGFTITVTNNGEGTATGVHVSDVLPTDAGTSWSIDSGPTGAAGVTCGIAAGTLTCDVASLASGGSFHLHITSPTTDATVADSPVDNTAVVTTTNDGSDQDSDSVRIPDLTIQKSFTGNSAGTDSILNVPKAKEGDTLTYTLAYTLTNGPVTGAVITDTLPQGLAYIDGTATGNTEFSFTGFDTTTRTLRWDATTATASGTVTYQARVLDGAAGLPQPLVNTATIDSNETDVDSDQASVAVAPPPLPATGTPKPTLPPTDTIQTTPTETNTGFSLMLVLLGLAGLALGIGFVTPVPETVRRRDRR